MELFAASIFVVVLAAVAFAWSRRTVLVLAGSVTLVLAGALDEQQAVAAIDFATLGLLVGMMVIVHVVERTGVFEHITLVGLRWSRGHDALVVAIVTILTATLSAFLDNLTTVLLMAPLVISATARLGMRPEPLLVLMILASNIGGTATLVGDPPNIMIAGATGLSFMDFLRNLAPVAVVTFVVVIAGAFAVRRSAFVASNREPLSNLEVDVVLARGRQLWFPVSVLIAVIAGFVLHHELGIAPVTVALAGATLMLAVDGGGRRTGRTLQHLDWNTIVFLAGLFVLVGALGHAGVLDRVTSWTADASGGSRTVQLLGILCIAAVGSGLVDNIPFTAAMIPVVDELAPAGDDAYWWALALGACFGGNATILAAAANVTTQGIAERHGIHIGFRGFLVWGLPTTFVSLLVAGAYLLVFHA